MSRLYLILLSSLGLCLRAPAQDLISSFGAGTEGWTGMPAQVDLAWESTGGTSNGYLSGSFTNSTPWYFSSPPSWSGDWRDYRLISWDLKLISGDYADTNANDLLIIEGLNGTNLTWRGPSPYWEWSHYELVLEPDFFGVDSNTFAGVMQAVTAVHILGEYQGSLNETVGLDEVVITTNDAPVQIALSSTFDSGIEGWRPYDDVTLSHVSTNGNPGGYLHGLDWADGRSYRFATPLSWAGDWSNFNRLTFDLIKWGTAASSGDRETVWIRGGTGQTLIWNGPGPQADWTSYEIYLVAENFGVDEATFNGVMRHVTEMLILGEYRTGDEQEGLDNVALSSAPISAINTNLISTYDSDLEDWRADGDGVAEWVGSEGNPGGYFLGRDQAQGPYWHFVTPEAWMGNWLNLTWLQFQLKAIAGSWSYQERPMVAITGMNGVELWWTGHTPQESWTPYFLPLTPEAFGTDPVTFNKVMAYVQHLRIYGEFSGGTDRAALDTFGLYRTRPTTVWPEQVSTFNTDMEDWRKFEGITLSWESTGGNPDGFLKGDGDGGGIWHYVSPNIWNGDWTGYQSLRFDHIILQGSNAEWADPTFYILGANNQRLEWKGPEAGNDWVRFRVNLSPALFGTDQTAYDAVMENVVELRIRGEYVSGSESEGLDNVYLSTLLLADLPPLAPNLSMVSSGMVMTLQFPTETNAIYRLQATTNLLDTNSWADVPGQSTVGDGGMGEVEADLTTPDAPSRHFRLRGYW